MPTRRHEVYPRVGGGNAAGAVDAASAGGLSPRGRGKRFTDLCRPAPAGSIPAWAGETKKDGDWRALFEVYPRVGGGNFRRAYLWARTVGLSPRGRGKRPAVEGIDGRRRSIPAWAGETKPTAGRTCSERVYPRVGGGNACQTRSPLSGRGLSPRGRGKLGRSDSANRPGGSIPAWAGETRPGEIPRR